MGAARPGRGWRWGLPAALVALVMALAGCDAQPVAPPPVRLDPLPVSAPPVLPTPSSSPPGATGLPVEFDVLDRLLDSGPLGPAPSALVVDAASGATLYDRDAGVARTPASVLKLATGAAALTVLDPGARLRTIVVRDPAGGLVLVGGGDTTLTRRPDPRAYPRRAGLVALADATAARLRSEGVATVSLSVDDSLYAGPTVSPYWPASYVTSGVVSPVSALSLDAGRLRPGRDARAADPAVAAGEVFSGLLRDRGVDVSGRVGRTTAPAGATELAVVESPTVAELVELMLASSDNDLAESLLRQVAVARQRPATFDDGAAVVAEVLAETGVPTDGLEVLDGSGLARGSTMTARTLAGLLVLALDQSSAPALDHLVTGLPVAGFSGTLSLRFGTGRAGAVAGRVRAKTGTLTGVSTLAGVTTVAGTPVVFVVMSDRVPGDTLAAREALDRFAAALAIRA